jgi:hypothetical protein
MTSMNHRPGRDQSQTPLFPACPEDYVTPENPVWFLDAFVASLGRGRLCRWTNGGWPD